MATFQYWRTDGQLYAMPPGIPIVDSHDDLKGCSWEYDGQIRKNYPTDFSAYVASNLTYIYATAAGRTMLDHFLMAAHTITISFALSGNAARAEGDQSMKDVAAEIVNTDRPGIDCRNALSRLQNNAGRFATFARMVNEQPAWDLEKRPGSVGGLWALGQRWVDFLEAQSSDDTSNSRFITDSNIGLFRGGSTSMDVGSAGLNLTTLEATNWIQNGAAPARLNGPALTQLRLATIVALYQNGMAGAGCDSMVGFNHNPGSTMNRSRPPGIGLGHELIHAYFSSLGMQPGHEQPGCESCVLFEFRCVGLGPWDNDPISENALRQQWPQALHNHRAGMDEMNNRVPLKRVMY